MNHFNLIIIYLYILRIELSRIPTLAWEDVFTDLPFTFFALAGWGTMMVVVMFIFYLIIMPFPHIPLLHGYILLKISFFSWGLYINIAFGDVVSMHLYIKKYLTGKLGTCTYLKVFEIHGSCVSWFGVGRWGYSVGLHVEEQVYM